MTNNPSRFPRRSDLRRAQVGPARTDRGFTLIETLVAVMILSMALAGPLSIASRGLQTALVAKDQVMAYYLGQDAIEYVRFARDTNSIAGNDWLAGAASGSATDLSACEGATGCYLDSLEQSPNHPTACSAALCAGTPLYYDANSHFFTYSTTGTARTVFTRSVSITTPVGTNASEAKLTVVVSWQDLPGVTHQVILTEDLYNWR